MLHIFTQKILWKFKVKIIFSCKIYTNNNVFIYILCTVHVSTSISSKPRPSAVCRLRVPFLARWSESKLIKFVISSSSSSSSRFFKPDHGRLPLASILEENREEGRQLLLELAILHIHPKELWSHRCAKIGLPPKIFKPILEHPQFWAKKHSHIGSQNSSTWFTFLWAYTERKSVALCNTSCCLPSVTAASVGDRLVALKGSHNSALNSSGPVSHHWLHAHIYQLCLMQSGQNTTRGPVLSVGNLQMKDKLMILV